MNRSLPSDDTLRRLHAQSLQALAPATLARLRQARHGATATTHRGRWRWWLASACSLVVALGIGLQFTGHGTLAGPPPDPVLASVEDNGALYDENPDLYLWLGDTDLAME
ncbi:hypothetical protein [Stenotrophomonas muris]|uniref:hypothetical protein n=1 Tax=Stenotrophomonas muris TaxID=2963283 RepID=UPI000F6CA81B|nr:hypothetical protein [Stenotrophomonas maltophilia]MBH1438157.1 hypothetical protein [Stenotrophomonas maltophilia]MCU1218109.1 hypothetical protein [Stenotrophomonas maltophilia]TQM03572.1 hypothetical protein FB552_3665 [Stenotrophomonas maltophilia]VEF37320.1 transmembrane protein [Stenotrophomonas maltophilia]